MRGFVGATRGDGAAAGKAGLAGLAPAVSRTTAAVAVSYCRVAGVATA